MTVPIGSSSALGRSHGYPRQANFPELTLAKWDCGTSIGTLRRECLDQMLVFGEEHLRRVLSAYATYYNQARTHMALKKDAPLQRAVQRNGIIVAIPVLAGLHHRYARI